MTESLRALALSLSTQVELGEDLNREDVQRLADLILDDRPKRHYRERGMRIAAGTEGICTCPPDCLQTLPCDCPCHVAGSLPVGEPPKDEEEHEDLCAPSNDPTTQVPRQ